MTKTVNIATKNHKDYFEIVIAGITIRFQTAHQSDIDCLEGLFLYHKSTNDMPYEKGKIVHNVIFSSERFCLPKNVVPEWEGVGNTEYGITAVWYNSKVAHENFIAVGKDILIHHIPEKNLSVCYLAEKKKLFRKFRHRPKLNIYIFLLIHNILSMYGKYTIHSACAAKNGLAYLFLGKSGYGKTTISTLLGKAGFDYMGDDLAFISRDENGEIVVDSFLCNAKIVNETETQNLEKNVVDVIKEYNFSYSYRRKLGAIFELQQNYLSEKSTLNPLSQVDVYTLLIHSGNNIKMQYNPQLWLDICEQAVTLPCYNLLFGDKKYFNSEILNI